ncbi:hypothetical protein PFHG_02114 [Plasmodium falciparum HB3]|uniref:Uncharacterized protein n=1 Tax=Plasmodium falciparum (isolate HB3) TaxID=137071 RepID=A0A0L7KBV8_PLAFX|nr:hypothetical protein PFHG_02114 [Plasmodium falciparum HB3]
MDMYSLYHSNIENQLAKELGYITKTRFDNIKGISIFMFMYIYTYIHTYYLNAFFWFIPYREVNQINDDDKNYYKECNYKLFFFIIQLQQKIKDLEKENEKLKYLLKKYNRESIHNDNKTIKRALLVVSFVIFIIIFLLF